MSNKLDLVLRNTKEVVTLSELEKLLSKKKKPSLYIGAAPTGKIHVGYYVQAVKIKDFIKAGIEVKYLLADIHSYLDDRKSPWILRKARAKYYKEAMTAILKSIGSDTSKVKFVLGSSFQKKPDYIFDFYKIAGEVSLTRSRRAASGVTRENENPKVGSLNYPLMQAIDVHHLGADIAFAGTDQRKIYMLAREEVPKLGHQKPICIFTEMIPGLVKGKKMSASEKATVITIHDSEEEVKSKMLKAYCPEGVIEDNGVLALAKYVILPANGEFEIRRPTKFGSNKTYKDYITLEKDYVIKKLHPADLKEAVAREIYNYVKIVRKHFKTRQNIIKEAYP